MRRHSSQRLCFCSHETSLVCPNQLSFDVRCCQCVHAHCTLINMILFLFCSLLIRLSVAPCFLKNMAPLVCLYGKGGCSWFPLWGQNDSSLRNDFLELQLLLSVSLLNLFSRRERLPKRLLPKEPLLLLKRKR